MRAKIKTAALLALPYFAGVLIALGFTSLRAVRLIRVEYSERLPRRQRSMLIISNHPSLIEPFVIPSLFCREWIWRPLKWGPWSTPARENVEKYGFWLGGARNIPIPRVAEMGESKGDFVIAVRAALGRIGEVLRLGGRVVVFPEGGRTTSPKYKKGRSQSPKGNQIRPLHLSIAEIVEKENPHVLVLWVEYPRRKTGNGWTWMRIKVGCCVQFPELKAPEIKERLEAMLLALADEERGGGD